MPTAGEKGLLEAAKFDTMKNVVTELHREEASDCKFHLNKRICGRGETQPKYVNILHSVL